MSEKGFWTQLKHELSGIGRVVGDGWHHFMVNLRNGARLVQGERIDYVVIPLQGSFPERNMPPRSFFQRYLPLPPEPMSLERLNNRLQLIGEADNVGGVLFVLQGLAVAGLATLQNLRRSMARLQEAGKEVVVYTPYLDLAHYYVATGANRIFVPAGAEFTVMGLSNQALFLKDALARLGVQGQFFQISPYKTAGNMFSKSEMTPEQREQLEWLLDENFEMMTAGMASGRNKSQADMKALIDQAPCPAGQALALGLVDGIAYEDELVYKLAQDKPKANLRLWAAARDLLLEKPRRTTNQYIGVISLEGAIMMGQNRHPPIELPIPLIGGNTAGETTISQLLQQAEKESDLAALIFHVDSPGGLALASDLIGRHVKRLARKKPVLVYMGNVAASGGYYVAAPAGHIMAQAGTITGSIGVLSGRFYTDELYDKLSITRTVLSRGKRAKLYSDVGPLTPEEGQLFFDSIHHSYQQFKEVVAEGRKIPLEDLDPICEGRVWSGRQALGHKLVDSHGDFVDAVQKAAELAHLPTDAHHYIPVINFYPRPDGYSLPQPFEAAQEWLHGFLGDWLRPLNNQPLWLMPFDVRFW